MVADCQSRFTFLAADRVSAAVPLPTSLPKTRVGGSRACASGRLSRPGRGRSINTPGLRACAYKSASGRGKWPNRDPLGDNGSLVYEDSGFYADPFLGPGKWDDSNLYDFVLNSPINWVDWYGTCPCDASACRAAIAAEAFVILKCTGSRDKTAQSIDDCLREENTAKDAVHDNCKGCSLSDLLSQAPPQGPPAPRHYHPCGPGGHRLCPN
jgi:hypothetical protein